MIDGPEMGGTFAVLTPPGVGAVAVVTVRCDRAGALRLPVSLGVRGGRLDSLAVDGVSVGDFAGEEVVVVRTSEGSFEIHCHGGRAAVSRLCEALGAAGLEPVDGWRSVSPEFDRVWGRAMTRAATGRVAGWLLGQRRVWVEFLDRLGTLAPAERRVAIEEVRARAPAGEVYWRPRRWVLCGRPNVGKSSLMNAMAGYARSIVSAAAGTTRDVVGAELAFEGLPVTLEDTAGVREGEGAVEAEGVRRAWEGVTGADVRLVVFDRSRAVAGEDLRIADAAVAAGRCVFVANKSDLAAGDGGRIAASAGERGAGYAEVSAVTGAGVSGLAGLAVSAAAGAERCEAPVPFASETLDFLDVLTACSVGHDRDDA